MRLGQRRLEEANAWGHAQARLTSSRGAARESGESEARRPNTGTIPDGGLARHPMEERPPACLRLQKRMGRATQRGAIRTARTLQTLLIKSW